MKRKEISVLIASALAANMFISPISASAESIQAMKSVIDNSSDESSSSLEEKEDDGVISNAVENNGVSVEQLQEDFINESDSQLVLSDTDDSTDGTSDTNESVDANSTSIDSADTSTVDIADSDKSDIIYLSDINYDSSSYTKYKQIEKNANTDKTQIRLKVAGEVTTFEKGMGAHAESSLVYDISSYTNTYTVLSTFLGVDYGQNGKGNGVKFTIYTSDDKVTWTPVKSTGVLTASGDSQYIYLDVTGVKYIKLFADPNGANSNDHAVYGDLKLIKPSSSSLQFKTVEEYDRILSSNTIEDNIANNENIILKRALVNMLGYDNLQYLCSKEEYKEALEFLANNELALRYFVADGGITKDGSALSSIKSFCNIYNAHKDELVDPSDNYFNLRLAVSISLAYSRDILVRFWIISEKPIDAVKRYEIYQELVASGVMDEGGDTSTYGKWSTQQFKNLTIPMMKWVVDTRMNDDEIEWLADYVLKRKNGSTTSSSYLDAYTYIAYTSGFNYTKSQYFDQNNYDTYNNKYGFGDYFDDYGTRNIYRLWMIFEEGAVCGGLSKTYANISEVFGRPSSVAGQPGHAAALTYGWNPKTNQYEWYIQNDIFGWAQSGNEYSDRMLNWGNKSWSTGYSASYLLLATAAVETQEANDKYIQATIYNLLANSYSDLDTKEEIYRKALEVQSINLDAYEGLANVYKANGSNKTSGDFLKLAEDISKTYTYYPLVMSDLMNYIKGGITNSQDIIFFDLYKTNALNKAKVATEANVKQSSVARTMANSLIGNSGTVNLATFSFDGENAGKIILNEKYNDSEIRVRYSLDGQQTWKETNDHVIQLTNEEIASITSAKDIVVGLVGIDDVYTIDIKDGEAISTSYINKNDISNTLEGRIANLQFSTDNGATWCDYTSDITFDATQTVEVRYRAHGVYLEGAQNRFSFNANNELDTKKLIPFKNISLVGYSTQEDNSSGRAASGIIDSNPFTAWHTKYGFKDTDKFVSVELDRVRYISAVRYEPGGQNGRFKNANVYVSLDGEKWTLAGTATNLANNESIKDINLTTSVPAKFVKVVATETYGNSQGEYNMYASGKALYFYEDITKSYNPTEGVSVAYSETEPTNENVTATLILPEGCSLAEGESNTHEFTSNGSFTFNYTDVNGDIHSIEANVNNIDKEVPTAKVVFEYTEDGKLIARLTDISSDVVSILNTNNGEIKQEFSGDESVTFDISDGESVTFELTDRAGNIGTVEVSEKEEIVEENNSNDSDNNANIGEVPPVDESIDTTVNNNISSDNSNESTSQTEELPTVDGNNSANSNSNVSNETNTENTPDNNLNNGREDVNSSESSNSETNVEEAPPVDESIDITVNESTNSDNSNESTSQTEEVETVDKNNTTTATTNTENTSDNNLNNENADINSSETSNTESNVDENGTNNVEGEKSEETSNEVNSDSNSEEASETNSNKDTSNKGIFAAVVSSLGAVFIWLKKALGFLK